MSHGGDPFAPPLETLRRRTGRKWSKYGPEVLPAWIADMDFLPAPSIRVALEDALASGDFGYGPTADASGVSDVFAAWAERRWGWALDPGSVMLMPDVVGGLANAIEALTAPGDGVLVQTPAYPPLMSSVRVAGRRLIDVPLGEAGLGLDAVEAAIRAERPALMILCHPHNPTGRVFGAADLRRLGELALEHGTIVVSDEVHADLALDGRRHIPFASLSRDIAAITVTLNAASKAFNVAGLRCAVCVAEGEPRARLNALPSTRWNAFSTVGVRAARAAWSDEGEAWLEACVAHLERQRDRLASRLPACGARMTPPQAGYLAWLDFRGAGLDGEPAAVLLDEARVALSPGLDFGLEGRGFARLNFATSEALLDAMLERMSGFFCGRPA
ncbi:MAG TPA: aminotransferase class I/II-fold pyridoxal phosphate-dependent enzyme [Caulobacteraceae bacterium]|nr:aminotransferase class I/II-fold pyridoxal phosphate-dependent enzyme [Caulobacteraceae bacterium]